MDVNALAKQLRRFVQKRDWEQFHSPKNLVMALAGESGELLEIFQWMTEDQSRLLGKDPKRLGRVSEEIADIAIYLIRLCDTLHIDLEQAIRAKFKKNASKYPVALAKGNATKYTELRRPAAKRLRKQRSKRR